MEPGETILQTAARELKEECGLICRPEKLKDNGSVTFQNKKLNLFAKVYIYTCNEFTGNVTESSEMKPQWWKMGEIPYELMRPDTAMWLPAVLEGKKLNYFFYYDANDQMQERREA